jgi:hypothetical protein
MSNTNAKDRLEAQRYVAMNRRARHDYHIMDTFEAGIVLTGTEVKTLRNGRATIGEAYASIDDNGEAWLINANIPEFSHGNRFNHEPKRPRKLLLHAREISKLHGAVTRKGGKRSGSSGGRHVDTLHIPARIAGRDRDRLCRRRAGAVADRCLGRLETETGRVRRERRGQVRTGTAGLRTSDAPATPTCDQDQLQTLRLVNGDPPAERRDHAPEPL